METTELEIVLGSAILESAHEESMGAPFFLVVIGIGFDRFDAKV